MSDNINFKEDLKIDKSNLDEEWVYQPILFSKYSTELSKAEMKVDKTKEYLEVVKAEIMLEVHSNPEEYGIKKVTQAIAEACVATNKEVRGAEETYRQAKYEKNMLLNAVRAFEQRKTALENIVRLYGQQYFSTPQAKSDDLSSEEIHDAKKSISRDIVKERRRRRRKAE